MSEEPANTSAPGPAGPPEQTKGERLAVALVFSLPAAYAVLGWHSDRYCSLGSRDGGLLAAALVATLILTYAARGVPGLKAVTEQGIVLSATWTGISLLSWRLLGPSLEFAARGAMVAYAAGALSLFLLHWHLVPLEALLAAGGARRRALGAVWLLSAGALDISVAAAFFAFFSGVSPESFRLLGMLGVAVALAGLIAVTGAGLATRGAFTEGGNPPQ